MAINSKKKGNAWENRLANWFLSHGFKAWKDGASGGQNREKGDVGNTIDFTIESKAAKNIQLPTWWRQVKESARLHNNPPVLFIHQNGMRSNPPEWFVVMSSDDWIEMLKGYKEPESVLDLGVLKYRARRVREELRLILKETEGMNTYRVRILREEIRLLLKDLE